MARKVVSVLFMLAFISTSLGAMASCSAASTDDAATSTSSSSLSIDGCTVVSHVLTDSDVPSLLSDSSSSSSVLPNGRSSGDLALTTEQWQQQVGSTNLVQLVTLDSSAASSVDLSASPYFPIVGDQGSSGSCAAFSETYYSYGYLLAKQNNWTDAYLGNTEHLLSPMWSYNKQNNGVDLGSYRGDNAIILSMYGAATMSEMPLDVTDVTDLGTAQQWREAVEHGGAQWNVISYNSATEISNFKALLQAGYTIDFGLKADDFYYYIADSSGNQNNIISSSEYHYTTTNHAQTIVGFDDAVSDNGEVGAFKVVNSWGSSFGDNGYYYITYDAMLWMAEHTTVGFITLEKSEPSLLATWHFDSAPSRDAVMHLTLYSIATGHVYQTTEVSLAAGNTLRLPTFMCFDISSMATYENSSAYGIRLSVGDAATDGTLSSFKIERYYDGYVPGEADRISEQAVASAISTPGQAQIALGKELYISDDAALMDYKLAYVDIGTAAWLPTDAVSGVTYAMQSGDVGDGNWSTLCFLVHGAGVLNFKWGVSSDSGDTLSLIVDGTLATHISGDVALYPSSYSTNNAGLHYIEFNYTKDSAGSDGEDCGWIAQLSWSGASTVLYDSFERGETYNWTVSDELSANGYDYWGIVNDTSHLGPRSLWCAGYGYSDISLPNTMFDYYDQNMYAVAELQLPDLTGSSGANISFSYWAVTGSSNMNDFAQLDYYSGGTWHNLWTQGWQDSFGWNTVFQSLPTDAKAIRFVFSSDNNLDGGPFRGVYIDDVLITSIDAAAPSSSIESLPTYTTGARTLNITASDTGGSGLAYIEVYYRQGSSGAYTRYATTDNPLGRWGESMQFDFSAISAGDGVYQFYSRAIDGAGNVEAAPASPDASVTYDSNAPVTTASTDGLAGPGWTDEPVTVTLSSVDSLSGVAYTQYRVDGSSWTTYSAPFMISSEGSHTVQYRSEDVAGNLESTNSFKVNLDQQVPMSTIKVNGSQAMAGWYRDGVSINITASDNESGVGSVHYRIDGGAWTTYTGNFTLTGSGATTIDYYAVDAVGNTEAAKSVTLDLDGDAPVTTYAITGEGNSPGMYNTSVEIALTSTDGSSGMSHIYYRLNDEAWSLYTSSITIMQDGNYTLYFYSVDAVGNAEAIGSVEFSIDTTAPVTEISCDGSGGANGWFTSRIYFYAVISDELSGANRTYCRIDGGAWHLMDGSDMCSTDGTHTIEYYSIDAAGNVEAVRTAVFKIDGSAPTITLDRKDGDSITSSGLVLKVNGSDAVSGVDQLLISIDDGAFTTCSLSQAISGLSDGSHTITVKCVDNAGNTATKTLIIHVDTNPLSPSGPYGILPLLIIILAIIVLAAAIVVLIRRKK